MSDYINKSALIEQLTEWANRNEMKGLLTECNVVRGCIGVVESQPTLDEKEIIRKYGEQIIKKLEFESEWSEPTFDEDGYCNDDSWEMVWLDKAIEIIKEECGISE